jgi:hypothetical protein
MAGKHHGYIAVQERLKDVAVMRLRQSAAWVKNQRGGPPQAAPVPERGDHMPKARSASKKRRKKAKQSQRDARQASRRKRGK